MSSLAIPGHPVFISTSRIFTPSNCKVTLIQIPHKSKSASPEVLVQKSKSKSPSSNVKVQKSKSKSSSPKVQASNSNSKSPSPKVQKSKSPVCYILSKFATFYYLLSYFVRYCHILLLSVTFVTFYKK